MCRRRRVHAWQLQSAWRTECAARHSAWLPSWHTAPRHLGACANCMARGFASMLTVHAHSRTCLDGLDVAQWRKEAPQLLLAVQRAAADPHAAAAVQHLSCLAAAGGDGGLCAGRVRGLRRGREAGLLGAPFCTKGTHRSGARAQAGRAAAHRSVRALAASTRGRCHPVPGWTRLNGCGS